MKGYAHIASLLEKGISVFFNVVRCHHTDTDGRTRFRFAIASRGFGQTIYSHCFNLRLCRLA